MCTYDSGREYFGRHNVARHTVSERPSKGININPDYSDNATSWCSADGAGIGPCEAEVEGEVEHGGCLEDGTDEKWPTTTDTID